LAKKNMRESPKSREGHMIFSVSVAGNGSIPQHQNCFIIHGIRYSEVRALSL